jgi:hypothetical protein
VPLLREGATIGVFFLTRDEVNPFTEKQIELVTTFVDQAVIAIENTRLFEAEHQRTRELAESLEQQTATAEVLQVISSSPGDLQPVFTTMLEKAVHICDAKFAYIYRWDGDAFDLVATYNVPPAYEMAMKAMAETNWSQKKATVVLNNIMAEAYAMAKEYGPGSDKYNERLYLNFLKLAMASAGRLAPYQDPQLSTVKVGGDRERPLVVREGVTSLRIMEELKQKIRESGLLPSNMVDVTPNKV